jgi:hypothetical protein
MLNDVKLVIPDMVQSMTIRMMTELQSDLTSIKLQLKGLMIQLQSLDKEVDKISNKGK